jgi:flagellar basal-body rod modification protein FlgD
MTMIVNNEAVQNMLSSSSDSTIASSNQEMGKEDFLKLLVTQLQYQDPLNPMENVEFTEQLATFSSLEQLFSLNSGFTSMNAALQTQNNYAIMNLIGKDVAAVTDLIGVKNGSVTSGVYNLGGDADSVMIGVFDANGNQVRTLDIGAQKAGEYTIGWDGRNNHGNLVEDGQYSFEILAINAAGESIPVNASIRGKVTGITFSDAGEPILLMNGLQIPSAMVTEIMSPPDPDTSQI